MFSHKNPVELKVSHSKTPHVLVTDLAAPRGVTVCSSLLLFYVSLSVPSHCSRETSSPRWRSRSSLRILSWFYRPIDPSLSHCRNGTLLSTAMRQKSLFPKIFSHSSNYSQTHERGPYIVYMLKSAQKNVAFPQRCSDLAI